MKMFILCLLLLGMVGNSMAQEKGNTDFQIFVGDTVQWTPFEKCDSIKYNITNGSVIDLSYIKHGKTLRMIGRKSGNCTISALCGDSTSRILIVVRGKIIEQGFNGDTMNRPRKPATKVFSETYQFNPPADHFFISYFNPLNRSKETFCKIGDEEAYNNGRDIDRFWNTKTGKNYYYRPEAQGWTPDVAWEFQAFGKSFFPLNSFLREMPDGDLSQYYVGDEEVRGVKCWHFFVDQANGNVIQYWVDPSNGCTLRRQVNESETYEVVDYNLNYRKWLFGPMFKKSLHDKTR